MFVVGSALFSRVSSLNGSGRATDFHIKEKMEIKVEQNLKSYFYVRTMRCLSNWHTLPLMSILLNYSRLPFIIQIANQISSTNSFDVDVTFTKCSVRYMPTYNAVPNMYSKAVHTHLPEYAAPYVILPYL